MLNVGKNSAKCPFMKVAYRKSHYCKSSHTIITVIKVYTPASASATNAARYADTTKVQVCLSVCMSSTILCSRGEIRFVGMTLMGSVR